MLWEISHGCNLLGKEGDLGGVIASCGELDKSPAMEQESTPLRFHQEFIDHKRRGMLLYMYMWHTHVDIFLLLIPLNLK